MGTAPDHSAIINRAAKAALKPLGLEQKGRSRFWYDDHGWRAFFVEFQPSSWSKGTYCNVGAMWLWEPQDAEPHWAFHLSERIKVDGGEFVSFLDDPAGFERSVIALAESAVAEISAFVVALAALRRLPSTIRANRRLAGPASTAA